MNIKQLIKKFICDYFTGHLFKGTGYNLHHGSTGIYYADVCVLCKEFYTYYYNPFELKWKVDRVVENELRKQTELLNKK